MTCVFVVGILKIFDFFRASADDENNRIIHWICLMHLFWGVSTSMVMTLLPIFILEDLKGSYKSFGSIEGFVVFFSFMAKIFAGFLIDLFKKKLPMLKAGTVITVLSKVFLAASMNVFFVFVAKAIDRFAKGIRQAPSDAILAEISSKKGFAFSLRYMMNTSGYLLGSVFTSLIVHSFGKNFRLIFVLSIVPSLLALFILKNKIKYNPDSTVGVKDKHRWSIKDIKLMPKEYWSFIIIISILMFARFSEGFITLRAKAVLPDNVASFPMFMALYEIAAVLISIPIGKIADQIDKRTILLYGILLLFFANIAGLFAYNTATILIIYICAGLHMGTTHGLISSIIAKSAPKNLIGTAFAIYYGIEGTILLFANHIAGLLPKFAKFIGMPESSGPFMLGGVATLGAVFYIVKSFGNVDRLK